MNKVSKEILQLPLEQRAEMAFKEAVEEVIDEHARLKLPLHVWHEGKVIAVSAQELRSVTEATATK